MPKSIFGKLLMLYVLVVILTFTISVTFVNIFLSSFLSDEKVKLLKQSGDRINSFLTIYVQNGTENVLSPIIENVIKSYSENTNSVIWVADSNGGIIFISRSSVPKSVLGNLSVDGVLLRLPDERQYKNSYKEEGIVETGDFYGLFNRTGVDWVTVVRPFYYKVKGEKKFLGAVYLSTPLPELKTAHYGLLKYFVFAVLISSGITIIVVLYFSRMISRPLKKIKQAAKSISSGNFEKRIEDISKDEIGELAKSFNDMASELEKTENIRKTFFANISHELRTPMTTIKGFVDGMRDGTIPEELFPKYLGIVSDETVKLNKMANDILELAKMESGDFVLNLKEFGINEIIRICIIKMESYLIAKNIDIVVDLTEEETYVEGDIDAIERVIINLLHNSIKFSKKNGKISVSTHNKSDKVWITVEDNGIGIDQNEILHIWDRFYKVDKSRGENKEGSGLGLSIVKNIIERHNQKIWVESTLDIGTKFVFTLKIANTK